MHIEEPKFRITPVPLDRITDCTNQLIDILAIVDRANGITQVTTRKDARQLDKRDVFLVDESGSEVTMTLWGDAATAFDPNANAGKVIGIKGCMVKEFNG